MSSGDHGFEMGPAAATPSPLAMPEPFGEQDLRGPTPEEQHARHPVWRFVARRVAGGVVVLFVASVLIFLATNALPGNAAEVVLGKNASPAQVRKLEKQLGIDKPLVVQYVDWLKGVVHGDLGQSSTALASGQTSAPVTHLLGPALRNTFILATTAMILLVPLSIVFGTWAAVRAGKPSDYTISYVSLVLSSLPEFALGIFLTVIFFAKLDWLPPVALVPPGSTPLDHPTALILPILTLLGAAFAFCARQVRAGVLTSLRADYVRMARLNGLSERQVIRRYALRNALATSIQTFAQALQYLFGGIVVVELLYAYPGVGTFLVNAVVARDTTEVQAVALILAALYIAINIIADLLVVLVVPKLRTGMQ